MLCGVQFQRTMGIPESLCASAYPWGIMSTGKKKKKNVHETRNHSLSTAVTTGQKSSDWQTTGESTDERGLACLPSPSSSASLLDENIARDVTQGVLTAGTKSWFAMQPVFISPRVSATTRQCLVEIAQAVPLTPKRRPLRIARACSSTF